MSKRHISQIGSPSEAESSRKRWKEDEPGEPGPSGQGPTSAAAPSDADLLKKQSHVLWRIAMEYTNKEGRVLSEPFVKRVSKRAYPDYYKAIANPIGLEDIKKTIDEGRYPRLEHVKAALDLCFDNCMTFNMEGSSIYIDAKELKKAIDKAYRNMIGKKETSSSKKQDTDNKSLNLIRLLKARLQMLVDMTDDDGRVISQLFLELPNKKEWGIYYEHIKNPISFEEISKKIKQKKYENVQQFADDLELLCSNAFEFNEDGSGPYKDAKKIQSKFQEIMADLPEPFALAKYTRPRITLKLPRKTSQPQPSTGPPFASTDPTAPSTPKIQKPVGAATPRAIRPPPAATPKLETPISISAPAPTLPVAHANVVLPNTPSTPAPAQAGTPVSNAGVLMLGPSGTPTSANTLPKMTNTASQPRRIAPPATRHSTRAAAGAAQSQSPAPSYMNGGYTGVYGQQPNPASAQTASIPVNATVTKLPGSKAGLGLPKPRFPLKRATLKTEPCGRVIHLHRDEGVQTWMMRLSSNEKAVSLSELVYVGEEEDDDDEDMDVDEQPLRRPRGRPPKSPAAKAAALAKANARPSTPKDSKVAKDKTETQVKLNSVVMPDKDENTGAWYLDLALGSNIIEMGGVEGTPWKVHVERMDTI